MSEIENALLHWLAKVTNQREVQIENLRSPKILKQLISQISTIPPAEFVTPDPTRAQWQTDYINYKTLFKSIEVYYKSVLQSPLPMGLPPVNLLQVSKGEDKDGLFALLTIFFIACINSSVKEHYIHYIMQLSEGEQLELMNLIQDKSLTALEMDRDGEAETQEVERSKIDELYFKIQSLYTENLSLTGEFEGQHEEINRLKEQLKKLEHDNKKLKRELDEKSLYIQQKEQQEQEQQSSNRIITDSNQQVIHQLKRELLEQQKKHLEEKGELKQQIQTLKQQLVVCRDKIAQLQSDNLMGMTSNRKVHHQDCVTINQHKNITQKLQMKLKMLEQKETELQRELLRAKYEMEELQRRYKKEEKEKENLKIEYEKEVSNKSQMISQVDANKLRLKVMEALRDRIKAKAMAELQPKP